MTARVTLDSHRTPRALLSRVGRTLLWATIAFVLVRGLAGTLAGRQLPARTRLVAAGPGWPDDAARAVAVEFASAYLDQPPSSPDGTAVTALSEFAAPELVDQLALHADGERQALSVHSAVPAGVTRLDGRHALVTVAAVLAGAQSRVVRLAVPVARDARGGLVVYDLPSLAAGPAHANEPPPVGDALLGGGERAAISDVVSRYPRVYLAGGRAGLGYLVAPGAPVAAVPGGFELLGVRSLALAGAAVGPTRLVLVTVDVRDRVSGMVLELRYRVGLVRRDRWYVAELNGSGGGVR